MRLALPPHRCRARRFGLALAVAGLLALLAPAVALAQDSGTPGSIPTPVIGGELPEKPDEYRLTAREAIRIADRDPKVAETADSYEQPLETYAEVDEPFTWQIGYFAGDEEVVQVLVDDPTASVRESWTGYQVAWGMARGYEGQFGHLLNSAWVWIPLAAIFFFGLFDFRRPWKLVHLDLLVLLSFGISQVFFDTGNIGVSVPLVYPPLLYLLARMLWIGFRAPGEGLRPSAPITVLVIAVMFLLGFRVALNIADSGVIDVGYAGVIGADRIAHGEPIYDNFPEDNPSGDTYGPANYYAYVPFEAALAWDGVWDDLPAGHGAAIFFDLLTVFGLFVLGRRMSGTGLGVTLAFAWCAYPYTTYALQSNANDSLVAALLVWAFVFFASPVGRGVLLALASAVKFAPLALVPLFATGERGLLDRLEGRRPAPGALRPVLFFSLAFVVAGALLLAHPAVDPGLATFYDRTIENQLDRESPFSVWGQEPDLEWLQTAVKVGALALAVLVAFIPRRRSLPQIAALSAAALIASQLGIDHWFYLYIPWFVGLTFAALSAGASSGSSNSITISSFSSHQARADTRRRWAGTSLPAETTEEG
jgi:hypothetical protein